MAKLSLSHILKRKKRVRLLTVCSTLLLLFAIVSIITSKNPWGAKAYPAGITYDEATKTLTISSGCTSGTGDATRCLFYGAGVPDYAQNPGNVQGIRHFQTNTFIPLDNDASLILSGGVSIAAYSIGDDTPIKLKNLTITGTGTELTHDALNEDPAAGIDPVDRFTLTPYGGGVITHTNPWRRINLQIDGNLNLLSGGRIEADAKGYPGGATNEDGWGRGRGKVCNSADPQVVVRRGGGAGYGGNGGNGYSGNEGPDLANLASSLPYDSPQCLGGDAYDSYSDQTDPSNWGSGGAGGSARKGGAGGGRIKIVSDKISIEEGSSISASGQSMTDIIVGGVLQDAGSGSGGSINIKTNYLGYTVKDKGTNIYTISVNGGGNSSGGSWVDPNDPLIGNVPNGHGFSASPENGVLGGGAGGGGRIAIYSCSSSTNLDYITSSGRGEVYNIYPGLREGPGAFRLGQPGSVYKQTSCPQAVTIKKTLIPIGREGAPSNGGDKSVFNPYALKKGDRIEVDLDFSNLIPGSLSVEEEMLEVKNAATPTYCDIIEGNAGRLLLWWADGDPANTEGMFCTAPGCEYSNRKLKLNNVTIPLNQTTKKLYYWCLVTDGT